MQLVFLPLFFLIFYAGAVLCVNFRRGRNGTLRATFERFDNTCGDRNVIIIFNYDGLSIKGSKMIMNSTITVKEDVLMDLRTSIQLDRCINKENLDTCEYFYEYIMDDYCAMIEEKHVLWTPLFSSFVPTFKCPIKKGLYRATNCEFEAAALLLLRVESYYWRAKIEVRDKKSNRLVTCMKIDARLSKMI